MMADVEISSKSRIKSGRQLCAMRQKWSKLKKLNRNQCIPNESARGPRWLSMFGPIIGGVFGGPPGAIIGALVGLYD